MRFGYQVTDKWMITLSDDHMKYVVANPQEVAFEGDIDPSIVGEEGIQFFPDENTAIIDDEWFHFEHTDGLNYINIEAERMESFFQNRKETINLQVTSALGAGILFPKSNVTFFGKQNDEFHVAGYGISASVGLQAQFWGFLLLQLRTKGGFINMPDIVTQGSAAIDRADQKFWFIENFFTVGFLIGKGK